MGLGDLFDFDEVAYRNLCSTLSTHDLRKREKDKKRKGTGGAVSMAVGGLMAIPTSGLSLIGSVYGARKLSIAEQKLDIIVAELHRRGIPQQKETARDILIPIITGAVGMGLEMGVESGIGDLMTASAMEKATEEATEKILECGYSWPSKQVDAVANPGARELRPESLTYPPSQLSTTPQPSFLEALVVLLIIAIFVLLLVAIYRRLPSF